MTANIPAITYDPRSPSEGRRFYVELNGNDQNDGLTPASPFKTWATALTAVNNLVPPVDSNNPAAIYSSSSGTFFEQIVVPGSVSIFAPSATLEFNDNGTTTLDIQGGNGVYQFRVVRNSGIGSIGVRSTDASLFTAEFDLIDCDDGTAFYHAGNFSGGNVIDCKNMRYGVAGVNNISTLTNAGLKVNVEVFRPVDASAEAFIQNGANPSVLEASEVSTTEATGATFINCKQGMIDAQIERTETTDAIIVENTGIVGLIANNVIGNLTVNAGGILNARIISYFGVKTFNGTVNGNIAGDRRGTDEINAQGSFFINFGNNSISSSSVTRYLVPNGTPTYQTAPTTRIQGVMEFDLDVFSMTAYHDNPQGNGNDITYTLEKNGVPVALSVTLASDGDISQSSILPTPISYNRGDRYSMRVSKSSPIGASPDGVIVVLKAQER